MIFVLNMRAIITLYFLFPVLVEKDQNPMWDPPTIHKVDDNHVDQYFSALPPGRELIL
jgi:hypothetical protein